MAAASSSGRVPQGEVIMEVGFTAHKTKPSSQTAARTSGVGILHTHLTPDKLENAAVELERRRITRDEAAKAARAMEALEVKAPDAVNGADVDLIVGGRCSLTAGQGARRGQGDGGAGAAGEQGGRCGGTGGVGHGVDIQHALYIH